MDDKNVTQRGPTSARSHIHVNRVRAAPASTIAILGTGKMGTGKMGSAIAARLSAAGFEVVLWNRTRSRAEALGLGTVTDSPAAAARDADIVVSSLTGPEAVLAAYLGPDGALSAGDGRQFVEMSTAGPDLVAELAQHVSTAGGTLVDAPIMGAPPVVRAGEATILAGGADEDVTAVGPVLSALGAVRHVGRWAAPRGSSSWPTACSPTSSRRRPSSRLPARPRPSTPRTCSGS